MRYRVLAIGIGLALLLLPLPSRAEKILIIGDSHSCGDFGKRLVDDLAANGQNRVVLYCAPGLSSQHWLLPGGYTPKKPYQRCKTLSTERPKLEYCGKNGDLPNLRLLLQKEKPDHVVPALGTNNLGLNALKSFGELAAQVRASGARCSWIGPPTLGRRAPVCRKYGHNLGPLIERIERDVEHEGMCRYIDSRPHTDAASTPDCMHRSGDPARRWADGVASEVLKESSADSADENTLSASETAPAPH